MLQHLETLQVIMNALVEEDFELARGLTELHLGVFVHRHLISPAPPQARQDAALPEASQHSKNFPPVYDDLAMAHNAAAEELAKIIPTKDLKQILPQFNSVLKACVACHLEFTVREQP
jgi:cytochrome c556